MINNSIIRIFTILTFPLFLFTCQLNTDNKEGESIIGKYKQVSGAHYDIIKFNSDKSLTSKSSSRIFSWIEINEYGSWKICGDTLKIHRIRHDSLVKQGYNENQEFIIKGERLYEIEKRKSNKEKFLSSYYFEKQ
jgi:hypothetical protein